MPDAMSAIAMLDRWRVSELEQARLCRALAAGGRHGDAAYAAEHEDRARILAALSAFAAALDPGDRPHVVSHLRQTAAGHRERAAEYADVATIAEQFDRRAERLSRVADAFEALAREIGR
ncbi:hypothetical protein GCM10010964_43430 [Caldovatus sediminis]|uniref:Uncharacterized protein n=1 Tax=Caldovatus sediminis TaxID=2041189 RepID=A0A8J3EE78_9PROT|nr:hypothetical protein [Caldovatus sediminis]GGG51534.1 hypothetical protein GCM10010964_43430 [Caldovatus sediminis]